MVLCTYSDEGALITDSPSNLEIKDTPTIPFSADNDL